VANLYLALDFRAFTDSLLVSLSRWVLAVKANYLLVSRLLYDENILLVIAVWN